MAYDKHYIGEIGTAIVVDCQDDISDASVTKLKIKKPDGTTTEWAGVLYGSQFIRYVTVADDFDISGPYEGQAYVEGPTWKGRGETFFFMVYEDFT